MAGGRVSWNNTGRLSRVCSCPTQTFAQPPPLTLGAGVGCQFSQAKGRAGELSAAWRAGWRPLHGGRVAWLGARWPVADGAPSGGPWAFIASSG